MFVRVSAGEGVSYTLVMSLRAVSIGSPRSRRRSPRSLPSARRLRHRSLSGVRRDIDELKTGSSAPGRWTRRWRGKRDMARSLQTARANVWAGQSISDDCADD